MKHFIDRLEIVRTPSTLYVESGRLTTAADIAACVAPYFAHVDREHMLLLPVDGRLQPRGFHPLSIGTTSHAFAAAAEVFRVCVLCCGTRGFVLVHNHLSGRCQPSESDLDVTAQLLAAGRVMGIPLVDHLIVATTGRYHSMHEADTLDRMMTDIVGRNGTHVNSGYPEEKR